MEEELKALREKNQVRTLTGAEEGTGVNRLPPGVYGFTYAPASKEAPLFREKRYHNFEVHKLSDAAVQIVGFVPPPIAAKIQEGRESIELRLLADPSAEASALVAIDAWRIAKAREHSTRDGKGLEVELSALV